MWHDTISVHAPHARVSPEWRGKARATRDTYIADGLIAGAKMGALIAEMEAEYRRCTKPLAARWLMRMANRWRAVPRHGCLGQTVTLDKRRLAVTDVRVTGSTATQADWADKELGLCLVRNVLTATPQRMVWSAPLLSGLSLHSIGRWYARAWDTAPEALVADLTTLAQQAPLAVARRDHDIRIATGNGGSWRGTTADNGDGHLFASVRSFFSED